MTFPLTKLSQRLAQNVLEFSLILALVAGGIILGAPYVRRSWNAYIKSLEEGIDDSYHDPYDRSPGIDMPCSCGEVYGQPPDTCGFGPCSVFEYRRARDCFPFGCDDDMNECILDAQCCTDWIEDDCGTRVTHADPCKQNEMAYWKKCGDGKIYSECRRDTRCGVSCYWENPPGHPGDPNSDQWCFPGEHDSYLTTAQPVWYVDPPGDDCPPSAYEGQCYAICNKGYYSTTTACEPYEPGGSYASHPDAIPAFTCYPSWASWGAGMCQNGSGVGCTTGEQPTMWIYASLYDNARCPRRRVGGHNVGLCGVQSHFCGPSNVKVSGGWVEAWNATGQPGSLTTHYAWGDGPSCSSPGYSEKIVGTFSTRAGSTLRAMNVYMCVLDDWQSESDSSKNAVLGGGSTWRNPNSGVHLENRHQWGVAEFVGNSLVCQPGTTKVLIVASIVHLEASNCPRLCGDMKCCMQDTYLCIGEP